MGVYVCVCMLSFVQLFALEQWHMKVCMCVCAQSCPTLGTGAVAYDVCVCVLNLVQLFALKQWHIGVCVCMHTHAKSYLTLYWSSGIWLCVCACVHAQ